MIVPVESSPEKISIIQHEKLSGQVWLAFHTDWMQQLLQNLAVDFISDYLSLDAKIDCTLNSIWQLKESYLATLHDTVSSRYKRKKISAKTNANLRKRAEEAEKSFPDVKIISDDPTINKIKIYISQIAPAQNADSFLI